MNRLMLVFLVPALFQACGQEQADTAAVDTTPDVAIETDPLEGIDWFDGTVDEAFAAAKASGKPIFPYWGAEWCPPCHAISAP